MAHYCEQLQESHSDDALVPNLCDDLCSTTVTSPGMYIQNNELKTILLN
jgi:hypothetical protein